MAETNVEQLHVIKDTHRRRVRLSTEAIDFLIEQTERAQQDVEKHLDSYCEWFEKQTNSINENEQLREALQRIRDLEPLNHEAINKIAREALEQSK